MKFKIKLVKLYLEGASEFRLLEREYGLKTDYQIRAWVRKYKNSELTEDKADQRGKYGFKKKYSKTRRMK